MLRRGRCDGSSKEYTLESRLIELKLMDRKWSHTNEDTPGSVFYWFKHVMAAQYTPDYFRKRVDGHCGICYTEIDWEYRYVRTGLKVLNITEKADVELPDEIVSGSECINLGDDARRIVRYLVEKGMCERGMMTFTRGRFDIVPILRNRATWKAPVFAFPIRWFYFPPAVRGMLRAGQFSGRYGMHAVYDGNNPYIAVNMSHAVQQRRTLSAYELFRGLDEYRRPCDWNTDAQAATPFFYAVIDKDMAGRLLEESYGH